jgi:hypothetical protein
MIELEGKYAVGIFLLIDKLATSMHGSDPKVPISHWGSTLPEIKPFYAPCTGDCRLASAFGRRSANDVQMGRMKL